MNKHLLAGFLLLGLPLIFLAIGWIAGLSPGLPTLASAVSVAVAYPLILKGMADKK